MKKIIINISDKGSLGRAALDAFEKKYKGADIRLHNPLDEVLAWLQGKGDLIEDQKKSKVERDAERALWQQHTQKIAGEVSQANDNPEIIICAHGELGDITHCYYEIFDSEEHNILMSCNDLASWLLSLSSNIVEFRANQPINLILSMCYAARTEDVFLHHIDQKGVDFSKTFAGNFIKALSELSPNLIINLTAFTGAVGFDDRTGDILVSTEERIIAKPEMEKKYLHLNELRSAIEALEREKEDKEKKGEKFLHVKEYNALTQEFEELNDEVIQQDTELKSLVNYGMVSFKKHGQRTLDYDLSPLAPSQPVSGEDGREEQINRSDTCTVFSRRNTWK